MINIHVACRRNQRRGLIEKPVGLKVSGEREQIPIATGQIRLMPMGQFIAESQHFQWQYVGSAGESPTVLSQDGRVAT
jgi:hypothetical protein